MTTAFRCGTKQAKKERQEEAVSARFHSNPERFTWRENTTNTATGTSSLDVCCPATGGSYHTNDQYKRSIRTIWSRTFMCWCLHTALSEELEPLSFIRTVFINFTDAACGVQYLASSLHQKNSEFCLLLSWGCPEMRLACMRQRRQGLRGRGFWPALQSLRQGHKVTQGKYANGLGINNLFRNKTKRGWKHPKIVEKL